MRLFFGFAIALASLFMTSCDYDKQIDELKDRVTALENSVTQLKEAYQDGKIITKVESAADNSGYSIVFSDGSTIKINHGIDGQDGADAVTPVVKIDAEGYWSVSYDGEATFSRILDGAGNAVSAIGIPGIDGTDGIDGIDGVDGNCVRVVVGDNGLYAFETYAPENPEQVIETIVTPYSSDSKSALRSIVKDEQSGVITLTLGDGSEFKFNLDVSYPTSVVVLNEPLRLTTLNDGILVFRLNPSDAYISFVTDGDEATIELDIVTSQSRASYVNGPTGYKITSVVPDTTDDGAVKQGQYKATVTSLNLDENLDERACLVITTKNSRGETIRLSSNPFSIVKSGTDLFSVKINGVEGEKNDNLFLIKLPPTTDRSALKPEFDGNFASIMVKGESMEQASQGTVDFSNPVTLVAASSDGDTQEYTVAITFSNLPTVYVNTTAPIDSKETWVSDNTLRIFNAGEQNGDYSASMKGRGNSTWGFPKKPYAIKLDKKSELLGMPKHKRWCLLANWLDRTNLRNEVSFEIGRRLSGLVWTPSGEFVDLVFNGEMVGNYYLCEQIKVDPNRVDIDEMKPTDLVDPLISGGYLLEFDTAYDEVNKFRTQLLNLPVNIQSPDEDVLQPAQMEYLENYVNNVESKLVNQAPYSEIEALIDVNSYIDWWLLHELTVNWEPNHPKSSYMYKAREGKLYSGPAWDFDYGTFREYNAWIVKTSIWYSYLFLYPEFTQAVKSRWQEHRAALATIPDYIDKCAAEIRESMGYDCERWPINVVVAGDESLTFEESVSRMKRNYTAHFNWIDRNIGRL
ncbi:MAG: hypothetical protein HDS41_00835 [Bacteroides sp.]|nr:hypothetical protein [Bacteroides sp.]